MDTTNPEKETVKGIQCSKMDTPSPEEVCCICEEKKICSEYIDSGCDVGPICWMCFMHTDTDRQEVYIIE